MRASYVHVYMSTLLLVVIFRQHGLTPRSSFFFFNDTATTEIYTLSLHDALPISDNKMIQFLTRDFININMLDLNLRSEEHTSELQSPDHLVCRLLLEKKNINPPAETHRHGAHLLRRYQDTVALPGVH